MLNECFLNEWINKWAYILRVQHIDRCREEYKPLSLPIFITPNDCCGQYDLRAPEETNHLCPGGFQSGELWEDREMLGTFWHRSEMIRRSEKKKGLKNVFEKGKRKRGREVRSQEIGVNFFLCGFLDDTTLLAESKDKLKSLLMRVKKKSERAGLSLNIKKQTNKQLRSWHPAPLLHGK